MVIVSGYSIDCLFDLFGQWTIQFQVDDQTNQATFLHAIESDIDIWFNCAVTLLLFGHEQNNQRSFYFRKMNPLLRT